MIPVIPVHLVILDSADIEDGAIGHDGLSAGVDGVHLGVIAARLFGLNSDCGPGVLKPSSITWQSHCLIINLIPGLVLVFLVVLRHFLETLQRLKSPRCLDGCRLQGLFRSRYQ